MMRIRNITRPTNDFRWGVFIAGVLIVFIGIGGQFYLPISQKFADLIGGVLYGGGVMLILTELVMINERRESRLNNEKLTKHLKKLLSESKQERDQHKEEKEEDLKKFLALEEELKSSRMRAAELHAQLELVGAHERSRIYAAIYLGYFSNQRDKQVESYGSPFCIMALKLNLEVSDELMKANTDDIFNMLEVNFGPAVSGAFTFGCLIAYLNENGYNAMAEAEIARNIHESLNLLKCDQRIILAAERFWNACIEAGEIPEEASGFFEALLNIVSGRFLEIPRDTKIDENIRIFLENPIRIPKMVRINNVNPPENGKSILVRVCGRQIWVSNSDGKLQGIDYEDLPQEEDVRWQGWISGVRGYKVRPESGDLVMERTWGYSTETPPFINLSVEPPSESCDREPKERFVPNIAPPLLGQAIVVQIGNRRVIVHNTGEMLYGVDEVDEQKGIKSIAWHLWNIREEKNGLTFVRHWRYTDEPR